VCFKTASPCHGKLESHYTLAQAYTAARGAWLDKREMKMRGAGGTSGGEWSFVIGLAMMIAGFYLLFNSITVDTRFGLGMRLYGFGGFGVTSGMLMIPFIAGVIMIFYSSKNPIGWVLSVGALIALIVGVLAAARFRLSGMTSFDLIVILVLAFGGLGFFLRSLREKTTE